MAIEHMQEEADRIEEFVKKNPEATVQKIGKELDLEEPEVIAILDQWHIDKNGVANHIGPGQGGGWHPARLADAKRNEEVAAQIDSLIEEREAILAELPEDSELRPKVQEMIAELSRQKQALGG